MGQMKVMEEITEIADQDQKQKDLQLIPDGTDEVRSLTVIELREKQTIKLLPSRFNKSSF